MSQEKCVMACNAVGDKSSNWKGSQNYIQPCKNIIMQSCAVYRLL